MKSNETRHQGRRRGRGGRQRPPYRDPRETRPAQTAAPKKPSLWARLVAFFTGAGKKKQATPSSSGQPRTKPESRRTGPPERVEVTSPRLFIGNLSYEVTEDDLAELFNGVGQVQGAEIATHPDTYRSKGFGFVTMLTLDEAVRAVTTLHDKSFMGRKLVVNGSHSEGRRDPRE